LDSFVLKQREVRAKRANKKEMFCTFKAIMGGSKRLARPPQGRILSKTAASALQVRLIPLRERTLGRSARIPCNQGLLVIRTAESFVPNIWREIPAGKKIGRISDRKQLLRPYLRWIKYRNGKMGYGFVVLKRVL
jgi:hypothetical protein